MKPWVEASKPFRCPHCNSDHWCSYNTEYHGWICMWTKCGKPTKNGGSWFPDNDNTPKNVPKPEPEPPHIDAGALMVSFRRDTRPEQVSLLADNLSVSRSSLENIGIAWVAPLDAWVFPMFSGSGECIGIMRRFRNGTKKAIAGSKALAAELQVPVASMLLPTKDLREYVRMGGTLDLLKSLERQLVWRQPK